MGAKKSSQKSNLQRNSPIKVVGDEFLPVQDIHRKSQMSIICSESKIFGARGKSDYHYISIQNLKKDCGECIDRQCLLNFDVNRFQWFDLKGAQAL